MTAREHDRYRRRRRPGRAGTLAARGLDRAEGLAGVPTRRSPRAAERVGDNRADHLDQTPVAGGNRRPRASGRPSGRQPRKSTTASRILRRLTTRRAAMLALVVCALALSIAVPLRTYLQQRDDLRAQLAQQDALRVQASQLAARAAQLSDPAEIEAEARTRLRYVLPGQTPYVVQLPGGPTTGIQPGQQNAPGGSWYEQLWKTIVGNSR